MKMPDNKQNTDKAYDLRDLQQAIAPFEDVLIANLPTKDMVLARCKQRKLKKIIGQLLLLCIVLTASVYWLDPIYQTESYSTNLGERKTILLEDGTQLHLNSNTQLRVAYGLRSKKLNLLEGEASFAVQHYAPAWLRPLERKFLVTSGNVQIEDIGTVFNVRNYDLEHSVVSVQTGQVRLVALSQDAPAYLDLFTGQSAVYKDGTLRMQQHADFESYTAWQQGYIQFKDTSLAEAIAELQRYQQLQLDFMDRSSQQIKISGRFNSDDAELFLLLLPQISAVEVSKTATGRWQLRSRHHDLTAIIHN